MIKALKRAIIVVAILNLLAAFLGLGWVASSGRVSKERVIEMVSMFKETVVEEEARLKAEEAEAKEAEEQARSVELPSTGMTTDELNKVRVELTQIDRARLERMQQEIADLQDTLRRERLLLVNEQEKLDKDKADFAQMRKRINETQGTEQFTKALKTYSGMAPKSAMQALDELIKSGGRDQAVSYLSSMSDRIRTEIMTQFIKDGRPELAAQLLEDVRKHGVETSLADGTSP